MNRSIRAILGALLGLAALSSYGQACTTTISPGADLTATAAAAAPGSVICLNAGTYFPPASGFPSTSTFAIGNGVTVKGLGATPAGVVLQGGAGGDHAIYFTNYLGNRTASNAQLINVTVQGSQGGIQVYNAHNSPAGRLTDIKLKDVVITTLNGTSPTGFGVLVRSADRVVLDNVRVTSNQTALFFIDVTDSVAMNSTVTNTLAPNATGLSVLGGSGNRFVNNTIGSPRGGGGYSFNGGGIVFYNTSDNRFEGNTVQGMRDDALDFSIVDLSSLGIPLQKSLNNYVGKNRIDHTAFTIDNKVLGSSGIWSNCASDGTWIYGNETTGAAECGICVWGSKSNMVQGNLNHNNGITGIFLSGGQEALDFCAPGGNTSFRQKPSNNFLQSNANYFNKNDEMNVRDSDNTDITRNFASPLSGFGGLPQACTNSACQSSMSLESDGLGFAASNGFRILANTSLGTNRGLWADSTATTGIDFYLNRTINVQFTRLSVSAPVNIDRGPTLGGNYWSNFVTSGNPGSTPYTGVFDSTSNTTGRVVDRYAYQSEDLGRGFGISVFEPLLNSSVAAGTRRTVRWDSIGCVWVDLALGATPLASNLPNIGYAVVTIPSGAANGSTSINVTCKDASGAPHGTAGSPKFNVTSNTLQLVSPGRDDVFNAGQQIWVGWRNTSPGTNTTVFVDYSTDGGATWPTTLATINNLNTNPVTSARVTLPAGGTAYGMIRVRSTSAVDQTDGVFAVRGAAGSLTNAGRTFVQGQLGRVEWSSPTGSRLVTINATVNGQTRNVATNLPDRGSFDWILPDFGGTGAMSVTVSFMTIAGGAIGSATNPSYGTVTYPTTVTPPPPPPPAPSASRLVNISTRMQVLTGDNVMIGGFVIGGSTPKTVVIRARGPSMAAQGVPGTLQDPVLQLFSGATQIAVNDNWQQAANQATLQASGFAPPDPLESAIYTTLAPGAYTAIVTGSGGTTGVGLVEVFEVDHPEVPLINIATRGQVLTGNNVMIAGFIIQGPDPKTVVVRARGPSMAAQNVPNLLMNPRLDLYSGQTVIASNDDWQGATNASQLSASGYAPPDPAESAIMITLPPGAYTAIVSGVNNTTGVGIVEVFGL